MKKVIVVALLAFLASQFWSGYPMASAQDPLPATGQTLCFEDYVSEAPNPQITAEPTDCFTGDCPGQDGLYQAGCLNDANRFILHLGPNGVLENPDPGDPDRDPVDFDDTVTDKCTGLMWQAYTADVSGDGIFKRGFGSGPSDDRVLWCEALDYCENLSFAGFSDWRLPNIHEAQSLIEHGLSFPPRESAEPMIHPTKFHIVTPDRSLRAYWTSTHVPRKDESLTVPILECEGCSGGTGYEVGDLLDVDGGILSGDGSGIAATFTVAVVDFGVPGGAGAVTWAPHGVQGNPGKYSETPANPATTTSRRPIPGSPGQFGPGGSGAVLEVEYNPPRIAYFIDHHWGTVGIWDGAEHDVRNGIWVRAVRSVTAGAGAGGGGAIQGRAGGDGAERGGGAGPPCTDDAVDVNGDGSRDLSDAIYLLAWLFQGGLIPAPFCTEPGPKELGCAREKGNTNGDEARDLSDVVWLLAFLFQGGPEPVPICGGGGVETVCDDNLDNDEDGDTDCADSDCSVAPNCLGATGVLPDTNQTACQDENGEVIDCANVGACAGQDSLTDNGCANDENRFVDNGDGTVLDTCTGLLWLQGMNVGGGAPFFLPPSWCAAMDICENLLDGEAGFNDWRLPNIRELHSIMDYGRARPAWDTQLWHPGAPHTFETNRLWSSTSWDSDPDLAYAISLKHGTVAWRTKTETGGISGNWTPLAVRTP